MSVKRYDIDGYDAAMLDSSDGDYVLYDDVSEYIDLAHRWYNADGTFEVLDKDEVIRRRKDAAVQLATLAAQNRAMREVLERCAFVLHDDDCLYCPCCDKEPPQGHAQDCALAAALATPAGEVRPCETITTRPQHGGAKGGTDGE